MMAVEHLVPQLLEIYIKVNWILVQLSLSMIEQEIKTGA